MSRLHFLFVFFANFAVNSVADKDGFSVCLKVRRPYGPYFPPDQ